MGEVSFTSDKKDIKTIIDFIEKQYYTVGKYLQSILKDNGIIKNARDFMEAQRDYTWDKYRASNLIQVILMQYKCIPSIQVYRHDDKSQYRKVWDGQQRLTTIYLFTHDLLKLDMSKTIYPEIKIENEVFNTKESLNGKTFSELPELWRDIILDFSLDINTMNNATEEQAEEFYTMVNNGVKILRPSEIRLAAMGSKTRKVFNENLNNEWILHSFTMKSAKGNAGFEAIEQFTTLLINDLKPLELSKDNIDNTLFLYRENGLPENIVVGINDTMEYLNNSTDYIIECKKKKDETEETKKRKVKNYKTYHFKWLNKTNTIMFMVSAYKAIQKQILETDFSKWAIDFFSNPPEQYKNACGDRINKSIEYANVQDRLESIEDSLNNITKQEVEEIEQQEDSKDPEQKYNEDIA